MGIQGLLPLLKSIMVPVHIKDLEGCCVAVDTYSWLHKGALSCSRDLCKGLPTTKHIQYCMHRVNMLQHYGVKPILVFDGALLPMKIEQENKRARSRNENLARAIEHESNGNSAAAYECYQKAVDISPSIAHELIQVLKQENISYVVAPYEADAQMTFLALSKQVDAVITEDSDLIPFGCPKIIFKMDKFGQAVEFRNSMLQQNKELSLAGFTKQMLLEMCILSGCDYLQSLSGMGLKRAHALIKKFKSYDKVIKHLRYSTVSVPTPYEESFKKAILTFQHQRVYDSRAENIVHLSEISQDVGDDLNFLGPWLPQHVAKGIAIGDLDPFTQMPFQVENASSGVMAEKITCLKPLKHENGRKKLDLPVQKNLLTKYFCFASLEAKRNFRAPRISPKPPSPTDNSCFSLKEYVNAGAACKMKCLSESLPDFENADNDSPPNYSVENSSASEVEFSESPRDGMVNVRSSEHAFLLKSGKSIQKTCEVLYEEHDCKNVLDAVKGRTRTESRKVIVRSSYFQHKKRENDQENKQEKLSVKDDVANDISDNAIPESISSRNNYFNDRILKRKTSPNGSINIENVKPKHIHTDEPLQDNDYCDPDLNQTVEVAKSKGKFGSDISHLGHYSDIAEKSMERFVSVISSFKFSSGSRASGLRAPLKDVRNTCNNRSSVGVEFSRFAYVPNKRKTALASRKC
ncbi:XPG_N domain-containing protein/XPG_I domain-containing protein [Cephalotus follicularis]|uniref:Exonuclease 1 n=1 Tax=Cephalotus follicularis TaxID=3775 RepID=A0A1Q3CPZ3_CEPFO|nr:XPG_N domain-containing protein/XPG_I domain-containing protein [Cephalotus follicularis]